MKKRCSGVWKTVGLAAVAAMALAGCSKGGPATAKITGTVTLDGKPLADAGVAFLAAETGQMAAAQTDASGQFTIEAPVGKNTVSISKTAPGAAAAGDGTMPADGSVPPPPKSLIPEKYVNPKTSGLSVDVASGMEPVKFELTSR